MTKQPFPTFPSLPVTQTGTQPTKTWPPEWEIIPVESDVPDEGDEDDDDPDIFYVSCKLWFFSMCIDWPDFGIKIHGWKWNLPKGVHGPFPPPIPRIKFPPGIDFKGTLPVWPALTRLPDGTFTPPPKPANCEPAEASFCLTTSAFATTVANGVTRTTATQVKSTCATVTGCNLPDVEATKTENACQLTRRDVAITKLVEATGVPEARALEERAETDWSCEKPGSDMIIILQDRSSATQRNAIKGALEQRDEALKKADKPYGHHEARSNKLGYTAFFFVNSVGEKSLEFLAGYQEHVSRSHAAQHFQRPLTGCADQSANRRFKTFTLSTPRLPCRSETMVAPPGTSPSPTRNTLTPCASEPSITKKQTSGTYRCFRGMPDSILPENSLSLARMSCTIPQRTGGHLNGRTLILLVGARLFMSWKPTGPRSRDWR